jgi:hypothetical protein
MMSHLPRHTSSFTVTSHESNTMSNGTAEDPRSDTDVFNKSSGTHVATSEVSAACTRPLLLPPM